MLTPLRNEVALIAYADRLGGSVDELRALLDGPLEGLFGGVHVLPFYTPFDGADAGFDPADHTAVDPRLGTWEDVKALAAGRDVAADVIVNHVSTHSELFGQALERGAGGPVLCFDAVFPDGATQEQLLEIYRPRPGLPFTPFTAADGSRRLVWTTFTSEQADLDLEHPEAAAYLSGVLRRLAEADVRLVRLDAVGYAIKRAGTSCFMLPQTVAFVDRLVAEAHALGLHVLVEVHGHHTLQQRVARHADLVYDFALPPLVLHALQTGDVAPLRRWLDVRPANAVTVLDTHDGIGVVDVGADRNVPGGAAGLLADGQLDALVEAIHTASGGTSRQATGAAASNVDLYQVNCTFFDALGGDEARYLLARLLQLFVPGLPQVYYVGLLAGSNDLERLRATGIGRDINRHAYTREEVGAALARPVVQRVMAAIRLRNGHPAFGGSCTVPDAPEGHLVLEWRARDALARLDADLAAGTYRLAVSDPSGATAEVGDVLELQESVERL